MVRFTVVYLISFVWRNGPETCFKLKPGLIEIVVTFFTCFVKLRKTCFVKLSKAFFDKAFFNSVFFKNTLIVLRQCPMKIYLSLFFSFVFVFYICLHFFSFCLWIMHLHAVFEKWKLKQRIYTEKKYQTFIKTIYDVKKP